MNAYLLNVWDSIRASYWFVPSLLVSVAVVLSFVMPFLDSTMVASGGLVPESIQTTDQTARSVLSVTGGAMIGVTGTVFSITIVTLSLTSQQFGPRLLRRFMYDLPTQFTLGVFLSTGFYCLLLLRVIEKSGPGASTTPHMSVLLAVVLAVLSMAMLIAFIHRVALLIQAPHVVAAVARDLDDSIDRLFPVMMGDPLSKEELANGMVSDAAFETHPSRTVIRSVHEGYIQALDAEAVMDLACRQDVVFRLRARPGDFIVAGGPLADVAAANDRELDDALIERVSDALNDVIIVGIRRTPRQDLECAIDELVEVAVRSLSPGINDPFTAINCVDRLGAAMGRLAERRLPSPYRCDADGSLRVIALPVSFGGTLNAAFSQIRRYGRGSVAVTQRLLESMHSIAEHTTSVDDRKALLLQAEMTLRLSEAFKEEHDRKSVKDRFEQLKSSLDLQES